MFPNLCTLLYRKMCEIVKMEISMLRSVWLYDGSNRSSDRRPSMKATVMGKGPG